MAGECNSTLKAGMTDVLNETFIDLSQYYTGIQNWNFLLLSRIELKFESPLLIGSDKSNLPIQGELRYLGFETL